MWLGKYSNDRQHLELINGYAKYAGFDGPAKAFDITAKVPEGSRDPMFIVELTK